MRETRTRVGIPVDWPDLAERGGERRASRRVRWDLKPAAIR